MASQQGTQQATQPYDNPRRLGQNLSDISEDDATDVICLLHPNSPAAFDAVQATMLHAPQQILQNEDLENIGEEDLLFNPGLQKSREFALRMSSTVKSPKDGFRFGRNRNTCDVLLTSNPHEKLISNVHFKIFVNDQGSLMLEDLSTNGTIVDDDHLRCKDKSGRRNENAKRAIKNGTIICVLSGPNQQQLKLMVRFPNRGDNEDRYNQKLKDYLYQRGTAAKFDSIREAAFGNHWNGGLLYNFTGYAGKGAFATVYRIQTKNEGTVYAAKEIDKRRFIKNGHLDMKFDSELKIMKDLKHPNIVQYIDCQLYKHWIYIIMEYVPYGELATELQERKFLPEPEVQTIAKQVMRALDYLHRRTITHRDIKPDNILISCKDPLIVKLSDFGLSKCVGDQETFLKTFCGTLLYCAPEVYPDYNNYVTGAIKRRRIGEPAPKTSPYDHSVDMWSLGAVIFHVLCGKAPIMGRGDDRGAQMLSNIMTLPVDLEPLREKQVSKEGIDLIVKLLNRNPLLRPREQMCLDHPWLKNVPEPVKYDKDDARPDVMLQRQLEAVEEMDEDFYDEELIQDLNQLTQHNLVPPQAISPNSGRQVKRPRTMSESVTIPAHVAYPQLPMQQTPLQAQPGQRLFGEIGPSMLASSGVLPHQPPRASFGDMPELRSGFAQVSVNDYASFDDARSFPGTDVSGERMQYPNALPFPALHHGPAPSLLGAEMQIGQLKVSSPEPPPSDAATPDTTNPVTPRTRELSPSAPIDRIGSEKVSTNAQSPAVSFSRHIDLNLIRDEAAFAASVQAREASRAGNRLVKAETFHTVPVTDTPQHPRSMDTEPIRQAYSHGRTDPGPAFDRTIHLPGFESAFDNEGRPLKRFGRLTPLPGSFGANQVIDLKDRITLWGRGVDSTIQYPDVKDTRIPKYAIKILFWAPGMEAHLAQHSESDSGDWTDLYSMRTYISTSATRSIFINGFELTKESKDHEAALYGRIYNGDIITVYQSSSNKSEFLKYRVEILFGESARERPEKESPFVVRKEIQYHRQAKEKESMRKSESVVGLGGAGGSAGAEQPEPPEAEPLAA